MTGLESWIIPFTFIPGVGMLVLSTASRLQNVSVLIREIVQSQQHPYEQDLKALLKRTQLFHQTLVCFYTAIGLLAFAALIGSFNLSKLLQGVSPVRVMTTGGIICVIFGSIQLIRESMLAARMILSCEKTQKRIHELRNIE